MIAQIVVFSRKIDAQRKKNIAFRSAKIAQKFCEWKPYLKQDIFLIYNFLCRTRGEELLSMIRLDVVNFDHLDLPPIRYFRDFVT